MKCSCKFFLVLLTTLYVDHLEVCEGVTKRFVSSWDFSNENNWQSKNLPCPGHEVTFAAKPTFPIFVKNNVALKSIDFSYDVEMIFGGNTSFEFAPQRDRTCEGNSRSDSVFENKRKGHWWDPDSWQCDSEDVLQCNRAVPDVYRVPCMGDNVVIPGVNDSVYNLIFTDPVPTVKSLKLGAKNLTTSEFFAFASTEEGRKRVTKKSADNVPPVYIENEGSCNNATGCTCNPSTPVQEICRHMLHKCPSTAFCAKPVRMEGFCCKMCGGMLSSPHNMSISFAYLQNLLRRVLKMPESKNVDGFVSNMPDAMYHVYFIPRYDGAKFKKATAAFQKILVKDFGAEILNTLQPYFQISEEYPEKYNSNIVTAIFSVLVVIAVAVFAVCFYKKRRIDLPFRFRRMSFGNMSMRSRSASIPSSSHVAASYSSDGRSFTNPSFQETEGMASFTPLSSITTSLDGIPEVECPTQRVNPLYAAKMEKGISFSALKDEATVDPVKDSNNEKDSKKDQDVEGAPIPSLGKLSENSIQIDIDEPQEQEEHQTLCDLGNIKEEEEKEGGEEEEEGEGEEEGEKKAEPEMTLVNVEDEGKKDEEEDNMKEEEEDPLESLAKSRIGKSAQTEEQEDTSNVLGDLEKLDIDPFDI